MGLPPQDCLVLCRIPSCEGVCGWWWEQVGCRMFYFFITGSFQGLTNILLYSESAGKFHYHQNNPSSLVPFILIAYMPGPPTSCLKQTYSVID